MCKTGTINIIKSIVCMFSTVFLILSEVSAVSAASPDLITTEQINTIDTSVLDISGTEGDGTLIIDQLSETPQILPDTAIARSNELIMEEVSDFSEESEAFIISEDTSVKTETVNENAYGVSEEPAGISEDTSDYVIQDGGYPGIIKEQEQDEFIEDTLSLSGTDRNFIDAINKTVNAMKAWNGVDSNVEIELASYNIPASERSRLISAVINNNPELFYAGKSYVCYPNKAGYINKIVMGINNSYNLSHIDKFNKAANDILGGIDPDWSDLQKIIFIHDKLVKKISYDKTLSKFNAYDALVEGDCVCQGYSLALEYLVNKACSGADCVVVTSAKMCHAWNMVTVGGSRYYIDPTWDDPSNLYEFYNSYDYFLVSRQSLQNDHTGNDWVDVYGENVYSQATGNIYDNAVWKDMRSAMPLFEYRGIYYKKNGTQTDLYVYDFNNGTSKMLASFSDKWKVWGSSSVWNALYSSMEAVGDNIIISLPDRIVMLDQNGNILKTYSNSALGRGYIYGISLMGNNLYYDVYTNPPFYLASSRIGRYSIIMDEYFTPTITPTTVINPVTTATPTPTATPVPTATLTPIKDPEVTTTPTPTPTAKPIRYTMSRIKITRKEKSSELIYTGSEIKPEYTLTHRDTGEVLREGIDYTVTYTNNVEVGTAKATFTGIGEIYANSGRKRVSFKILRRSFNKINPEVEIVGGDTVTFVKGGVTPEVKVTYGGAQLVKGADYKLIYKNNKKVGTGIIMVKGLNSFSGVYKKQFTIEKQDISNLSVSAKDVKYSVKPYAYRNTRIIIYDVNGKKLTSADYKLNKKDDKLWVSESDTPEVGSEITVTVTGRGNYCGTATAKYYVIKK
ncbi:MAG: hypothetical protein K6E98_03220 [Lachnospiraceae bacterium]|nr:hypothetical protein [Lachnospiraceae bacterium]